MTVVEKITVFRSSAVSSAPRAHHPLHQKSSLITPTTPQLPPRAAPTPATHQLSLQAPQTLPKRCHPRRISASPTPLRARAPTRLTTLSAAPNPTPARPADLPVHHRQLPRLFNFPGPWPIPNPARLASCTAAQYSNAADQHRPTTSATGQRPAEMTTIDRAARSSGRRGRGFKSRHPDSKTPG
jgi:hypothetical protein